MSANTSIEWCHYSFSPWHGCEKVSKGCKFCYAEESTPVRVKRSRGLKLWGPAKTTRRDRTAASTWAEVRAWDREAKRARERAEAAGKAYERPRVFPSLCDVFERHHDADQIRPDFWKLIEDTPELDWLLLTKRPEFVREMVPATWIEAWPEHVWIGASVEDDETTQKRVMFLREVPAHVLFLSIEPLLGTIALTGHEIETDNPLGGRYVIRDNLLIGWPQVRGIDGVWRNGRSSTGRAMSWIIIGGESGHSARPCDVGWIRSLVTQAREAGVPVFVKQLGARATDSVNGIAGRFLDVPEEARGLVGTRLTHKKGGDPSEWPADLRLREFPQKRS